jgi:phosphinothricin acetyltransferase
MNPPDKEGRASAAIEIRDSTQTDIAAIHAIYAHYVRHGSATFEEVPPAIDELVLRRASILERGLPFIVAESAGRVVGYSYATAFHSRAAYRYTIEDSIYVAHGLGGHGIGSALLRELVARCEAGPWRQMIAVIGDSGNGASIALHRRMGFRPVGTLNSTGFKFGRWVDVVLMQRPLGAGDATPPLSAVSRAMRTRGNLG